MSQCDKDKAFCAQMAVWCDDNPGAHAPVPPSNPTCAQAAQYVTDYTAWYNDPNGGNGGNMSGNVGPPPKPPVKQ